MLSGIFNSSLIGPSEPRADLSLSTFTREHTTRTSFLPGRSSRFRAAVQIPVADVNIFAGLQPIRSHVSPITRSAQTPVCVSDGYYFQKAGVDGLGDGGRIAEIPARKSDTSVSPTSGRKSRTAAARPRANCARRKLRSNSRSSVGEV